MITQLHNNFDLEIASRPDSLNLVERLIESIRDEYKVCENDFGNIIVAVTEAVNNAITHGNNCDPGKKVNIQCSMNPDSTMKFIIADQGNGFNHYDLPDPTAPENLENPSGRGIFLMKNLADQVIFADDGRIVELTFKING
jgi:serine/threonine-protein kinase RsbW